MTKYKRTYENRTVKHELIFRGETFGFTMIPDYLGRKSDKQGIEYQISDKHPDITLDLLEQMGVDMLTCEEDDDMILDTLENLSEYEK